MSGFPDSFLKPQRIALVGASEHPGSMGAVLYRNLRSAGFAGILDQVNPKYSSLHDQPCYRDVSELPAAPDLAVICTPPATVPDIVCKLAERGCGAAVIITAGSPHDSSSNEKDFKQLIMEAVGTHSMRIIGPNCLGIQSPNHHIDASFSHLRAAPGSLAFITQSGAMLTTVLDWAQPHGIGFSSLISLGDMADVDIADLLDCFASDDDTSAILLYLEAITHGDKFLLAARNAARLKPVVVIKAGRSTAGAHAAASHTGMLTGVDAVYDTAFRRCGILRVDDMQELFAAAETLALSKPMQGERVAILTNGGGPGVLAADALVAGHHGEPGATLATLQSATINKLDAVLPSNWSHGNPVDIIGDAGSERYCDAIRILMDDDGVDALLVLNCPTAMASSMEAATAVASLLQHATKPVFTCWLGGATAHAARQLLRAHQLPCYDTPELAIEGILHRVRYHRTQLLLNDASATDSAQHAIPARDIAASSSCALANTLIDHVIHEQREWLDAIEVTQLLNAYHIPCVATALAKDAKSARNLVTKIGKPCAIKIMSRDITHKSDVGGVMLNIADGDSAYSAVQDMLGRIEKQFPAARIDGVIVQEMIHRPQAYELVTGFHRDAVFGPVLLFGQGGVGVEIINDRALELPPLSPLLARQMIDRTRIGALLKGFRNQPAVDLEAIVNVLLNLSRLMVECPRITEMDINPLIADHSGVLALDARVRIKLP